MYSSSFSLETFSSTTCSYISIRDNLCHLCREDPQVSCHLCHFQIFSSPCSRHNCPLVSCMQPLTSPAILLASHSDLYKSPSLSPLPFSALRNSKTSQSCHLTTQCIPIITIVNSKYPKTKSSKILLVTSL